MLHFCNQFVDLEATDNQIRVFNEFYVWFYFLELIFTKI